MKKIACLAAFGLSLVGCANGFDTYNINPGIHRSVDDIGNYEYAIRFYYANETINTNSNFGLDLTTQGSVEESVAWLTALGYKRIDSTKFQRNVDRGTGEYAQVINYTLEKVINFTNPEEWIITYHTFIEVYANGKRVENSAYITNNTYEHVTYESARDLVFADGWNRVPGTNKFIRGNGTNTYIVLEIREVKRIHR